MGVDDQVIVNPEEMNYLLEHNETHIRITIPTGVGGGKLEVSTNLSQPTHLRSYTTDVSNHDKSKC